jgi:transcriptional regulator with XRE-family HTH domain
MTIRNAELLGKLGGRQIEGLDDFAKGHSLTSQIASNKATAFPHTFGKDVVSQGSQYVRMGKKPTRDAANNIRAWRDYRRMSQARLAELCDTKDNVISNLESGERQLTEKWLVKLAKALETTPGYLLDHDPNDLDTELIRAAQEAAKGGNRAQVLTILKTFTGTNG